MFPIPEHLLSVVKFDVRYSDHDFGAYPEVVISFDGSVRDAVEFAYSVEGALPEWWDNAARAELTGRVPYIPEELLGPWGPTEIAEFNRKYAHLIHTDEESSKGTSDAADFAKKGDEPNDFA